MKNVIIMTRAVGTDGPSRGAICIANAISEYANVTFLCLSNNLGCKNELNKKIDFVKYSSVFSLFRLVYDLNFGKYSKLEKFCSLISMTIRADFVSIFLIKNSFKKIISVRGDFVQNYKDEYGKLGYIIAKLHYMISGKSDVLVCMSNYMNCQIGKILPNSKRVLIENFIDEKKFDRYSIIRNESKLQNNKFIFVGSLSHRKQILPLVNIFKDLVNEGNDLYLEIVGDGALKPYILELINKHRLNKNIIYRGVVKNPELFYENFKIFVMPSLSEGVSRAVLEALFFRLPVILRKIPQNEELVIKGQNGWLFESDDDLKKIIKNIIHMRSEHKMFNYNQSLIPKRFQYDIIKYKWKSFLEI